jgi:dipeptidyl aminopeptidase/acylaminoacyl peptidase
MRIALALVAASSLLATASRPPAPGLRPPDDQLILDSRGATLAATVRLPDVPSAKAPYPSAVLVHGSGRVTGADLLYRAGRSLNAMGFAVLAYDKRGVGGSTGDYASIGPANSDQMFDLLAADALAGIAALKARRDIDPSRIGLVGFSQAGWIMPLAASRSRDVAFVVIVSGPAVSVGEEIAYSRLAGEDPGSEQGVADAEIERRMKAFTGPHGYDPLPVLQALSTPSFWILGEKDRSIPLVRTVSALDELARTRGRPISVHLIPGVNHGLMDPATGRQSDIWRPMEEWLRTTRILR